MRNSRIMSALRGGDVVRLAMMGYFIPPFIAYAADAGYHGVWIDLEHHAMDAREVQALLAFCHHYDIDGLIRSPTREKGQLYRYLEDGAAGLIMPHVSTAETAREIVQKVRFPPLGDRGLEGFGFEANFGLDSGNLVAHANHETCLIVQIETPEALENVEAIAAVDGVDGLYIGPGDLGIRLALLPEATRPTMDAVMERVAAACARHRKAWGIFALDEARVRRQQELGARLLVWGADFLLLRDGVRRAAAVLQGGG
ncbi:MAG: aldolase/citrate lyase family protein [Chloroflexota bacterium]|nr:aldolase/citrate lyase family protein [Chloroflexota bacterium]